MMHIRSAVLSAPLLTRTELRCVPNHQRRFRSFIRRVDKIDQVYYQITKRVNDGAQDVEPRYISDLFEMPDLVLDLDAEDNPHVRLSAAADEERMKAIWGFDPRRAAIQARLKEFETELLESRQGKTRIWRPSQHDILSAALFGSPGTIEGREAVEDAEIKQQLDSIGELSAKNSIPLHAAESDVRFLEWLILRHGKIGHSIVPDPSEDIAAALQEQATIRGIRRIITQSLTEITNLKSYATYLGFSSDRFPSIPHEIRRAYLRIREQSPDQSAVCTEMVSFLGNLAERFRENDLRLGGVIHALALKASAEIGSLEASALWVSRGHSSVAWWYGSGAAKDVKGALDAYLKALRSSESDKGLNTHQSRQSLFQILTGLEEDNSLAPDSFRFLPIYYLGREGPASAEEAFATYEAYIRLLGRLGAIRTFYFEALVSSKWMKEKLQGSSLAVGVVDSLFHEALLSALQVAVVTEGTQPVNETASLEECVALDYHSIGDQNPDAWIRTREYSGLQDQPAEILSLPRHVSFKKWLQGVKGLLRQARLRATPA